ncbi:MAG: universal stress protein [Pseudomonadota bacterium]
MSIKTILTLYDGADGSMGRLEEAVEIARANDAHLTVFGFTLDVAVHPNVYAGVGSAAVAQIADKAREELAKLREKIDAYLVNSGIPFNIETDVCFASDVAEDVAALARFADLTLLPDTGEGPFQETRTQVVETVLFSCESRVVLLPDGYKGPLIGPTVIAWDMSREATLAVKAALPFLKHAPKVDIACVNVAEGTLPAARLGPFLDRHGIKAEVVPLSSKGSSISETLNTHADSIGAELMVMGAYGHSRLREIVFGGVTRKTLRGVKRPTLMAH